MKRDLSDWLFERAFPILLVAMIVLFIVLLLMVVVAAGIELFGVGNQA